MSGLEIPVRGLGPEALGAFLLSERSPPESMRLSDLDGFLNGIAGKTGRNDPCPCGSGSKFKKCCGP